MTGFAGGLEKKVKADFIAQKLSNYVMEFLS